MFPNLVIAGAPKCGTTSVFDWLSEHPAICASSVKETYFLMDKGYRLYRTENNYHQNGLDGYKRFFEDCKDNAEVFLEATPDYLYQETALNVIASFPKTTKVIFILRKPSDRVYSLFQFARNNVSVIDKNVSFSSFVDALVNKDSQGIISNRPILENAIRHSQYVDYLKPWIARMEGQVRVELFEDMATDPKLFMLNLANYLGIEGKFFEDFDFSSKNTTYSVKNQGLHKVKKKISAILPGGSYRRLLAAPYAKLNIGRPPQKTVEEKKAIQSLDYYFAAFNDELEHLTGLDLSSWRQ